MGALFGATLANGMLVTGALNALLSGGSILVFSGTPPAKPDDATSGNTLLVTIKNGAAGVTWENSVVNGVMDKTAAETWSGTAVGTGTASFYRYVVGTDTGTGAAAAGNYRIQGSVGTASADMVLGSTTITTGDTVNLTAGQIDLSGFWE